MWIETSVSSYFNPEYIKEVFVEKDENSPRYFISFTDINNESHHLKGYKMETEARSELKVLIRFLDKREQK